jgi:hypothetical protein
MLKKCFQKKFFFDKIKNTFKRSPKKVEEEEIENDTDPGFTQFKNYILDRKEYKWRDYEAQIEADIAKRNQRFFSKFTQKSSDEEKIFLDKTNRFISCLKEDELNKTKFKEFEIQNICKLTNLTRTELEQIMNEYLYYKGLHTYLTDLKNQGKPIPKTQTELQIMISQDRPEFLNEMQKNMYQSIRRMLGYSTRYVKKQEEKRQRENSKNRLFTYKI